MLALSLSACALGGGQSDAPEPTTAQNQGADTGADAGGGASDGGTDGGGATAGGGSDDGATTTTGGSAELIVDGTPVTFTDPQVACIETGDTVTIGVTSKEYSASEGIGAIVSAGDSPTVSTLGIVTPEGDTIAYMEGLNGASATATKRDSTYTITGTAAQIKEGAASMTQVSFEFTITCG